MLLLSSVKSINCLPRDSTTTHLALSVHQLDNSTLDTRPSVGPPGVSSVGSVHPWFHLQPCLWRASRIDLHRPFIHALRQTKPPVVWSLCGSDCCPSRITTHRATYSLPDRPPLPTRSMPRPRRSQPRKSKSRRLVDTLDEGWYTIRRVLQERLRNGRIEYLVDWDDNTETGEAYPPSWVGPYRSPVIRSPQPSHRLA